MAFSDKQAAHKYINNYSKENYDKILLLRKKGHKDKLKEIAKLKNMSLSEFINSCIDKELKRLKIDLTDSNK